jgi:hypothetical protein
MSDPSSSNAATPYSLSCTICSLNHGTTLWPDGTITNFTLISDLTRNYGADYNLTCPASKVTFVPTDTLAAMTTMTKTTTRRR